MIFRHFDIKTHFCGIIIGAKFESRLKDVFLAILSNFNCHRIVIYLSFGRPGVTPAEATVLAFSLGAPGGARRAGGG